MFHFNYHKSTYLKNILLNDIIINLFRDIVPIKNTFFIYTLRISQLNFWIFRLILTRECVSLIKTRS